MSDLVASHKLIGGRCDRIPLPTMRRSPMIRCGWKTLMATALLLGGLGPAATAAQVLETPEGKVEFIGLHHWTPEQVRDTLAALRPDVPLTSGACAAILQLQAGFPEAAVHGYSFADGNVEKHKLITLVEPEESDRVRFAPVPVDSFAPVDRWAEAYAILQGKAQAWTLAIQHRGRNSHPEDWSRLRGIDSTDYLEARAFLENHATEADLALALDILSRDRAGLNRVVAVGILSGFADREETWHALVRAARGFGPLDGGRNAAALLISGTAREAPGSIDWSPVSDDLAAILSGTNLFAFMPVLGLMAHTGLSPEMTRELLADGAPLVIDHLAAWSPMARGSARMFLEEVSGEQHGDDVEAWKNWMASL